MGVANAPRVHGSQRWALWNIPFVMTVCFGEVCPFEPLGSGMTFASGVDQGYFAFVVHVKF